MRDEVLLLPLEVHRLGDQPSEEHSWEVNLVAYLDGIHLEQVHLVACLKWGQEVS